MFSRIFADTNVEVVEILIQNGADVNVLSHVNETALHLAACNGIFIK